MTSKSSSQSVSPVVMFFRPTSAAISPAKVVSTSMRLSAWIIMHAADALALARARIVNHVALA